MKRLVFSALAVAILIPVMVIATDLLREPGHKQVSSPLANPGDQAARGAYLARAVGRTMQAVGPSSRPSATSIPRT